MNYPKLASENKAQAQALSEFGAVYDSLRLLIHGHRPEDLPEWTGLSDHHKTLFTQSAMPELLAFAEFFAAFSDHVKTCEH